MVYFQSRWRRVCLEVTGGLRKHSGTHSGAARGQMIRVTMAADVAISIWLLNGDSAGAMGGKMGLGLCQSLEVSEGSLEGFSCGKDLRRELEGVPTC